MMEITNNDIIIKLASQSHKEIANWLKPSNIHVHFNFSKQIAGGRKRRQLTAAEMTENVKILIKESKLSPEAEQEEEGTKIVRKRRFETEGGSKWWTGRGISCVRAFYK